MFQLHFFPASITKSYSKITRLLAQIAFSLAKHFLSAKPLLLHTIPPMHGATAMFNVMYQVGWEDRLRCGNSSQGTQSWIYSRFRRRLQRRLLIWMAGGVWWAVLFGWREFIYEYFEWSNFQFWDKRKRDLQCRRGRSIYSWKCWDRARRYFLRGSYLNEFWAVA